MRTTDSPLRPKGDELEGGLGLGWAGPGVGFCFVPALWGIGGRGSFWCSGGVFVCVCVGGREDEEEKTKKKHTGRAHRYELPPTSIK